MVRTQVFTVFMIPEMGEPVRPGLSGLVPTQRSQADEITKRDLDI